MRDCWVRWHCKRLDKEMVVSVDAIIGDNGLWMCECLDGVKYPYRPTKSNSRPRNAKICWTTGNDENHEGLMRGFRY